MEYFIGFVIGCVISSIIFFIRYSFVGILRVDHSNPEKDIYRFDINDLDKLNKKNRIVLKIDHHADLSQN